MIIVNTNIQIFNIELFEIQIQKNGEISMLY
jgi:hypothetical protein